MRICVVCQDFNQDNIRLQPWRYIYETFAKIQEENNDVIIISTGGHGYQESVTVGGLNVRFLKISPFGKNFELLSLLEGYSPDVIYWSLGYSSIFYFSTLKKIKAPKIGLWMGTRYSFTHLIRLGPSELLKNRHNLLLFFINTSIPDFLMKTFLKKVSFSKIIVMTKNNKNNLISLGVHEGDIFIVRPGIGKFDLEFPDENSIILLKQKYGIRENEFIVLYFGSPLTLRGIDILLNGVVKLRQTIPVKLIILSRKKNDNLVFEEQYLKKLGCSSNISESIIQVSGFLDKEEVKQFIRLSNVIALPFKIVQADMPISILESMAMGKPVISTNLGGIEELLDQGRGSIVKPGDEGGLNYAILDLFNNKEKRQSIGENVRKYMLTYPSWEDISDQVFMAAEATILRTEE